MTNYLYHTSATVRSHSKNIKNRSDYVAPVHAAWRVLQDRQAVHHRTQKMLRNVASPGRALLAARRFWEFLPRTYEFEHKMGKIQSSNHRGIPEQKKIQ